MDSAYKTLCIVKKILDDGRIPIVPYTRYKGKKDAYRPWDFVYKEGQDSSALFIGVQDFFQQSQCLLAGFSLISADSYAA